MDPLRTTESTPLSEVADRTLRSQLKSATGDVMFLGVVFALLGGLPLATIVLSGQRWRDSFDSHVLSLVDTVVLVGPGIWYVVAAVLIRRLNRRALSISIRVAIAQLVIVLSSLCVTLFADRRVAGWLTMPVVIAAFFMPALIAVMRSFRKIGRVMNQVGPEGHGFEPVHVLPVQPSDRDSPPPAT